MDPFTAVSAGTQLFGAGMSFIQHLKAKKQQKKAEAAAKEAVSKARREISVNYLEAVQVPKDAFNEQFRANVASERQALQAASEAGQRAAIGAAGRINATTLDANEKTRQSMQDALYKRDVLVAEEDSRISQALGDISLAEAEGAQVAAANYQEQSALALNNAISGVAGGGLTALEGSPLFGKKKTSGSRRWNAQTGKWEDLVESPFPTTTPMSNIVTG